MRMFSITTTRPNGGEIVLAAVMWSDGTVTACMSDGAKSHYTSIDELLKQLSMSGGGVTLREVEPK